MGSVITDIARTFPQLLNSINTIQNNIAALRVAIENIDDEIRGVFNEQLALEAINRARTKGEQIKMLMKDATALKVNANSILEKSLEMEEEINVFLQRTQTDKGDVVGLYVTAPLIALYGKAFTYSSRQRYINLGEDPSKAPNAFDSALTKKIIDFSEHLVAEYTKIESGYRPFKDKPFPEDKVYAYRYDSKRGLIKTNIKQWGVWNCMEQPTSSDRIKCLMDGLDAHQGNEWSKLYAIFNYIKGTTPPFLGTASTYRQVTVNGRTAIGWTLDAMRESEQMPLDQVEVYQHMKLLTEAKEFYEFKSGKFFSDLDHFTTIINTMKTGKWDLLNFDQTFYRAYCPSHDWEGQRRAEFSEAQKDLSGHIYYYPDESHVDARVIETDEKSR